MSTDGSFRMSAGYEVLPPRTGRAYAIPRDEWDFLKAKLRQVSKGRWVLQIVGSLLAGAALTTLVAIVTKRFDPNDPAAITYAWAVVAVGTVCSIVVFVFAHQQRQVQAVQISDVITQMELIERRYVASTEDFKTIRILYAHYGKDGKFFDITDVLAQQITAGGLKVVANNDLAGDPCKGVTKELMVRYEYEGKSMSKTVKERETLSLP